jgi:hypothetical protein
MFKVWLKMPPPTLQLIYSGRPVAELKREKMGVQQLYHFRYLPAFKELSLAPLPGLPESSSDHWSADLWAFFTERIPDIRRPEIDAFLKVNKINRHDDLVLLAELGGRTVTDPFEIRRVA